MAEHTTYRVSDVRKGRRFRRDMGDVAALAASIAELGLLQPIGLTPDGLLVFGERRLTAVESLGWESVPALVFDTLADAVAALKAERDENRCRKEMTPSELVDLGRALEEVERSESERRKAAQLLQNKGSTVQEPVPERKGQTRDKVGEALGVSGKHYEQAKKVVEKGSPELVKAMDAGELSVKAAAKVADLPKREQRKIAKADDPKAAAKEAIEAAAPKQPEPEPAGDEPEAADPGAEFVAGVDALCRDMDKVAARMKALKASRYAYCILIDSAVSNVEAGRKTLWQGRPAHRCPYCAGSGCKTCNGTGAVKRAVYEMGVEAVGEAA